MLLVEIVGQLEAGLQWFAAGVEDILLARLTGAGVDVGAELKDALSGAVRAIVGDALGRLRSDMGPPLELPADLIELAQVWARCDGVLPDPVGVTWVMEEVFWDRFSVAVERVLADPLSRWEVVKLAHARRAGHADRVSGLIRCAYQRELRTMAGLGDSPQRLVQRALAGYWVEVSDLGYDLAYEHVAVLADTPVTVSDLASRVRLRALVAEVDGQTWGWLGAEDPISGGELDELVGWQRRREGRVAFGEPAAGIAGFIASHHQALDAWSVAMTMDERAMRFADVAVLIALLRDRVLARKFVEHELRALAGSGERMRELRATLRAYLQHGQCVSATAAFMRHDRKTIQRQLQLAEELVHGCIRERSAELQIALQTADALPSGV